MNYIAVRKRKLLATVRVQSSLVAMDIWSPSNRSKRCSRIIRYQKTRSISKNRYVTFIGLVEKSPGGVETKDVYRQRSHCCSC